MIPQALRDILYGHYSEPFLSDFTDYALRKIKIWSVRLCDVEINGALPHICHEFGLATALFL